MAVYRVVRHDCDEEWFFDDENPPDYANPAKNPHFPGNSVEDADWSAKSAARGKKDGHQTDVSMTPPHESHNMEIVTRK